MTFRLNSRTYLLFISFLIACIAPADKACAQWSALGGTNSLGANNEIWAVCSDAAGNIYTAGAFTNANGHCYVAKYDGYQWSEVGGFDGLKANSEILTLCVDPSGNIYAAGHFTDDSDKFYVAKFNGSTWSELGGTGALGADNTIWTICSDKTGNIYAGGDFKDSAGNYYVAKYNGSTWSEPGGMYSGFGGLGANWYIYSVCSDTAGNVYAAGWFSNGLSNLTGYKYVAKYDGASWTELGGNNGLTANNIIYSMCIDAAQNIYVAGAFEDDSLKAYVAKWNGSAWSELGGPGAMGDITDIGSLCVDPAGNLYALTNSTSGGTVYKWNDSTWSQLASVNAPGELDFAMLCSDTQGNIYAGGFENIDANWDVEEFSKYAYIVYFDTVCPGSTYWLNGQAITSAGTYHDTVPATGGYDNILTLNLSNWVDTSLHAYFTLQLSNIPHLWYALNQCTGEPPMEYIWTWGDGSPPATGQTPSHTYDSAGYYTICVTVSDSMGCTATYCDSNTYVFKDESSDMVYVNVVSQLPTGISNVSSNNHFSLYPNPNNGSFTLLTTGSIGNEYSITDATGRLITRQTIKSANQAIDLPAATGVYILTLKGAQPVRFEIVK